MTETAKLYELASLAEASYVLFDGLNGDFSSESVEVFLKNKDRNGKLSATQAEDFVANWTVVSHQKNVQDGGIAFDSGFSATLFKNNQNPNEYVYALRGTEPGNWVDDIAVTDVGDIVTDGLAIKQIVDMYNDWQRLTAGGNQPYQVAVLTPLLAETAMLAAERFLNPLNRVGSLGGRTDIVIDDPLGTVNGAAFMTGLVGGLGGLAEFNIGNLFAAPWQQAA